MAQEHNGGSGERRGHYDNGNRRGNGHYGKGRGPSRPGRGGKGGFRKDFRKSDGFRAEGADADVDAADDDQAEGPVESTAEREADAVDDDAGEATEA